MTRTTAWMYPRQKVFEGALRKSAAAWFKARGLATHPKMSYCLDSWKSWEHNIILPEVASYVKKQKTDAEENRRSFPLHKYLHHGLSSQAMAFNLVGPLIIRDDLEPLLDLLEAKGIMGHTVNVSAHFEYEDREVFEESRGQPTSVDIALKDAANNPVALIESKLVEKEFGGCSVFAEGDCPGTNPVGNLRECYLHHIGRTYWTLMGKHGLTASMAKDHICPFTSYY